MTGRGALALQEAHLLPHLRGLGAGRQASRGHQRQRPERSQNNLRTDRSCEPPRSLSLGFYAHESRRLTTRITRLSDVR